MSRMIDLSGQKFGKLTVLSRAENSAKHLMWFCRCDCGKNATVRGSAMKSGNSTTCGCGVSEAMSRTGKLNGTHRLSRTGEYRSWARMIHRCEVPEDNRYQYYGARGISVCSRWRDSFETFLADMGQKPTDGHTIDRKDANGNYEPGNCRWATSSEQNKNRRPFKRNKQPQGASHGV